MNMSMISVASMPVAVEARRIDASFKIVLLFCCVGLVASFGLMTQGIDLGIDLGAGLM
jgi:hypothetical protein